LWGWTSWFWTTNSGKCKWTWIEGCSCLTVQCIIQFVFRLTLNWIELNDVFSICFTSRLLRQHFRSKSKVKPRTTHEGSEWEQKYSFTLSLTSALDGNFFQPYAPAALPAGKRPVTHFTGDWLIFLEECEKKVTKFHVSVVDFDTANRTQYFFNKKPECCQFNNLFSVGVSERVSDRVSWAAAAFFDKILRLPRIKTRSYVRSYFDSPQLVSLKDSERLA